MSARGSVIVPLTANKMLTTVNLKAKAAKGKQKPEEFVEGAKEVLEESLNGAPFAQAGLTMEITQGNAEPVEVNSVL